MKKVLIGIAVVVVLLIAGVLAAPALIDWNQYRDRIAAQVEAATGRPLHIGGDLSLSLLPRTALVAEDVRLASLPDAVDPYTVRVARLDVHVDLRALLGGTVRAESIALIEPLVVLERLEDGRATWEFAPTAEAGVEEGPGPAPDSGPGPGANGRFDLRLDSVTVERGTVIYRDVAAGVEERFTDITMDLAANSLRGPFRVEGGLIARDFPMFFKAGVGLLGDDRAAPVSAEIALSDGGVNLRLSGAVTAPQADGGRAVQGEVVLSGSDLRRAAATLAGQPLPQVPGQPFRLGGDLSATAAATTIENLRLSLGDTDATGSLAVTYGTDAPPRVDVALAYGTLPLDLWLAAEATAPQTTAPAPTPQQTPAPQPQPGEPPTLTLPQGLDATIDLTAEAVTWRDGVVRQAVVSAALRDGELTLSQVSAQTPGNGRIAVFGALRASEPGGEAQADLTIEAQADNLRGVLEWLGAAEAVAAVPGGRLGRFQATASVGGTLREIALRSLDATVDTTSLRGAATLRPWGPDGRPSVGATVQVGSLNLDAYRARGVNGAQAQTPPQPDAQPQPDQSQPQPQDPPLFAGLEALNTFDANLRADIETLTVQDVPMHDVRLDMSLVRGQMTLRESGVGEAMGASLRLSGGVAGFGGQPSLTDLTYTARVPDPGRLARAFGVDLPLPPAALGVVTLEGRLSGTPAEMTVDTRSQAVGASVTAAGTVRDALAAPAADVALTVSHPDAARLLGAVAPEVRLTGPLGALRFAGQVRTGGGNVAVSGLDLGLGDMALQGDVTADLTAGPRPRVQATLRAGLLDLDRLMPVKQRASLDAPLRAMIVPASWSPQPVARDGRPGVILAQAQRAAPGPWSTDPLDLSALLMLDGTLSLRAQDLRMAGLRLTEADIAAGLDNGTLTLNSVTGGLFGGSLTGTASAAALPQPTITANFEGTGVQVAQALQGLTGRAPAQGTATFTLNTSGQGGSTLALAESLTGNGSLTIRRLNVAAGQDAGGIGQALLGPIAALNQIAVVGAGRDSLGDLMAAFAIQSGVVRLDPLNVDSALYAGRFGGTLDLPRWTVDIAGEARLTQTLLTALLGDQIRLPQVIPVAVTGSLDDPRVRLDTPPPSGAAPPPATPEDAARQLLQQFLGVGQPAPQQQPAPAPEPQQEAQPPQPEAQPQAQPEPPRPEDILRGILRNIPR